MSMNQTPHLHPCDYSELRGGGSLKDGWAYLVPHLNLNAEVSVAFSDEEMEDHVREQSKALRALYLSSCKTVQGTTTAGYNGFSVEEQDVEDEKNNSKVTFVVKRGLEVVGVASYCEKTGQLSDVALRPVLLHSPDNLRQDVGSTLLNAVKEHARSLGLIIHPHSAESKRLFESFGFFWK